MNLSFDLLDLFGTETGISAKENTWQLFRRGRKEFIYVSDKGISI
jgi:hypothetical protein